MQVAITATTYRIYIVDNWNATADKWSTTAKTTKKNEIQRTVVDKPMTTNTTAEAARTVKKIDTVTAVT